MSKLPPKRDLRNVVLFAEDALQKTEPISLPLSRIILPSSQPRKYFSSSGMDSLIASIKREGILQPLLVRPFEDQYELVAGERRFRAAQILELTSVPVTIRYLDDTEAKLIALTENLQREDLNAIEETEGILALLSLKMGLNEEEVKSCLNRLDHEERGNLKSSETNSAHNVMGKEEIEEIFTAFNLTWQSFLKNRLPLLHLPQDILNTLREGKVEYTKAKAIARVKDEEQRTELLSEAIAQELSLSQIKEHISQLSSQESNPSTPTVQKTLSETYQKLKKSQLWKKDPKKWRKAQTLLKKLEELLDEGFEEISDS
jgi:ParB family chromosome partitioning protein